MTLSTTATELHRLMHCIGSRNMSRVLPEDHDHEARDEGNAADWLATELFEGRAVHIGARAPNGWIVTDEMMDHVRQYLGALDCGGSQYLGGVQINTSFDGDGWDVRGRADHIAFVPYHTDTLADRTGNPYELEIPATLTVDDLKYGHRLVSPERNWTLIAHAIGFVIRTGQVPERITLRIHQPRAYHPDGPLREWSFSYAELLEYHAAIAARLSNPTDELRTDLNICAKCHALPNCPAARSAAMNAVDAAGVSFDDNMPNDLIAYEMDLLRRAYGTIKNRADALEELIQHKVRNGEQVMHAGRAAQLKPRLGQRAWNPGLSASVLRQLTGLDLAGEPKPVTPAEAERRGMDKSLSTALTQRPSIGTKLEWVDIDAQAQRLMGGV